MGRAAVIFNLKTSEFIKWRWQGHSKVWTDTHKDMTVTQLLESHRQQYYYIKAVNMYQSIFNEILEEGKEVYFPSDAQEKFGITKDKNVKDTNLTTTTDVKYNSTQLHETACFLYNTYVNLPNSIERTSFMQSSVSKIKEILLQFAWQFAWTELTEKELHSSNQKDENFKLSAHGFGVYLYKTYDENKRQIYAVEFLVVPSMISYLAQTPLHDSILMEKLHV